MDYLFVSLALLYIIGPIHHRSPSRILYRVIRGMVPHKTARGTASLARLQVFEGIPPQFQRVKRVVVPDALRVLRLAPGRRFCVLKKLSSEMGWKFGEVVDKLEEKRKARGTAFHTKKSALVKLLGAAKAEVAAAEPQLKNSLAELGY